MPNTAVRVGEGATVFCLGQVFFIIILIIISNADSIIINIIIIIISIIMSTMNIMVMPMMTQDAGAEEGVTVNTLFSSLGLCRQVGSSFVLLHDHHCHHRRHLCRQVGSLLSIIMVIIVIIIIIIFAEIRL